MSLTFFSYLSSAVIHAVLILLISFWMAHHQPAREIIFSDITVISDGAMQGNTAVAVKTPVPAPSPKNTNKKPVLSPPKFEAPKPAQKNKDVVSAQPDKNPVAESKPDSKTQGSSPGAASTEQPQQGSISADSNPNAQPGGSKTMVGPVFSRAIRFSQYPEYPEWAQEQGIQTEVVLKFYVDNNGDVIDIENEKQSGYPRIDYLCRQALKRWKFDPLPIDYTRKENQWGRILFKFRLR